MLALPVMLNVCGKRCIVVGGGPTALRRAESLLAARADVTLIAPEVVRELPGVQIERRHYCPGDLDGAGLVIVATDDPAVNAKVAAEAAAGGALVNRADDPGAGDFTVAAHARQGPVTIAVHTDGGSPAAAAAIQRQLAAALDPDWPTLLQTVMPYRTLIQQRFSDAGDRRNRLRQLTDSRAMAILKRDGPRALGLHADQLATP